MSSKKVPCGYCNYYVATSVDHIFPKAIAKLAGFRNDEMPQIVSCSNCNCRKSDKVILPTIREIESTFIFFSKSKLKEYADFLYQNKDRLKSAYKQYLFDIGNSAVGFKQSIWNKFKEDYKEFITLYEKGFFT